MDGKDIKKNLQLFKESTGWTLIVEQIDKYLKQSTDSLTGDIPPPSKNMNELNKNEWDIVRAERQCWIDLKNLPDKMISSYDPVTTVSPKI